MIRTVYKYTRQILVRDIIICLRTFFFGDAVALLRENYTLVSGNSCFLQLLDQAYVSGAQCISLFLL